MFKPFPSQILEHGKNKIGTTTSQYALCTQNDQLFQHIYD